MDRRFEELVTGRGGLLWRIGWLLTGDPARAEELLGRALTRTWSRRHELDATGGALEEHALAELVRGSLPRRGSDDRPPEPRDWAAAAAPDWTIADPASVASRHELLESLALLTPRQRVVVVLRYAERRPVPEVAGLVGWSVADVQQLLTSALVVLRETPVLAEERAPIRTGPWAPDEEHRVVQRLAADAPEPPYVPHRAADAEGRGRTRRRRGLLAAGAGVVLLSALVVPAVLGGVAEPEPPDDATTTMLRVLREQPVPSECADIPRDPPAPDLPLDLEQASAVWLRFCPVAPRGRGPTLPFAPGTTLVSGVGELVESWVQAREAADCPAVGLADDGRTRLQIGTQDGQTHVLDLVLAPCGPATVDGRPLPVTGRVVFSDAVRALGRQALEGVLVTGAVPGVSSCPVDPRQPQTADRTTAYDYPRPAGVDLPLEAMRGLICRYRYGGEVRLVGATRLGREVAELIRVAYLARLPRKLSDCDQGGGLPRTAVVLTDATNSYRTISLGERPCGVLLGPSTDGLDRTDRTVAGRWLPALLLGAPVPPTDFGQNLNQ